LLLNFTFYFDHRYKQTLILNTNGLLIYIAITRHNWAPYSWFSTEMSNNKVDQCERCQSLIFFKHSVALYSSNYGHICSKW